MLDIDKNRRQKKYSNFVLFNRILWALFTPIFRFSPRIFFPYRNMILRAFGAEIGEFVHIYPSAKIYMPWNLIIGDYSAIGEDALIYNLGRITIGRNVTISHRAHLCAGTHDYTDPTLPLMKPPIIVEDNVWICTQAFVGPGLTIGEGAVIGAAAVATKDVPPWTVVGGNPAKEIKQRILKQTVT